MISQLKNAQGIALPAVLFLLVIVTLLGFTAMNIAENQTIMVNRHQQREQALHYAEAGLHRYMAGLNKDRKFYETTEGNAMQNVDKAFEDGYYRLEVTSPSVAQPVVTIRSTGWEKNSNIKRTIEVELHRKDFVQNLISSNTGGDLFWYTRRFIRGDVINGPLHINGDLIINGRTGDGFVGPIFNGPVTYSGTYTREGGTATDTTQFNAGEPVQVPRMGMPPTTSNAILRQKAQEDNCLFTGLTFINIEGSTLKIRQQTVGNDAIQTKSSLPANGIIYVQGATGNNKWDPPTANVYVSGKLDGRLTIVAENDIYITASDPTDWNNPGSVKPNGGVTYADLDGAGTITTANIESIMASCDDMLGLIANRNVRILHYNWPRDKNSSSGRYYWPNSGLINKDVAPTNIDIHASIFAVTGSFEYEEHTGTPNKGTLRVIGSISQFKIGPVAGFAANILDLPGNLDLIHHRLSGYGKDYWHDPRLMYDLPPSFLEPANSGWEIVTWREVNNPVVEITTP